MKRLLLLLMLAHMPAPLFSAAHSSTRAGADLPAVAATAAQEPKRKQAVVDYALLEKQFKSLPTGVDAIVASYEITNSMFVYLFGWQKFFNTAHGRVTNMSANGSTFVTESYFNIVTASAWDGYTYKLWYETPEHEKEYSSIVSEDGKTLVVVNDRKTIVYARAGDIYRTLYTTPDGEHEYHPVLSADGTTLVVSSGLNKVRVYVRDGDTYRESYTTPEDTIPFYDPAVSADGKTVAVRFNNNTLNVYVRDGKIYRKLYSIVADSSLGAPCMSADGAIIAVSNVHDKARVYVRDGDTYGQLYTTSEDQGSPAVSADGKTLAVMFRNNTLNVYVRDGKTYRELYSIITNKGASIRVMSSDGTIIPVGFGNTGKAKMYVRGGDIYRESDITPDDQEELFDPIISADGSTLAVTLIRGSCIYRTPFTAKNFNAAQLILLYELYKLIPHLKNDEHIILDEQQSKIWYSLSDTVCNRLMATTHKRVVTANSDAYRTRETRQALKNAIINAINRYKPVIMNLRFTKVLPWARTLNKDLTTFFDSLVAITSTADQTHAQLLEQLKKFVKDTTTRITPDSFGSINPQAKAAWVQFIKELNLVAYAPETQALQEAIGSAGTL